MNFIERFFERVFHKHDWRVVSAQVSGSWMYINASVTLECQECKQRKYLERGVNSMSRCLPTKSAGKQWIEGSIPPEAVESFKKFTWTEHDKDT